MKKLFFVMVCLCSVNSFAQTELVNMDPELCGGAQQAFSQQRQEQEENVNEDLSYDEAREVYDEEVINAFDAVEQDDEGTVY